MRLNKTSKKKKKPEVLGVFLISRRFPICWLYQQLNSLAWTDLSNGQVQNVEGKPGGFEIHANRTHSVLDCIVHSSAFARALHWWLRHGMNAVSRKSCIHVSNRFFME
mmetsp:Transcript_16977/g.31782  ORF Transcript_16977/g.31782 Transcript_16977/m.31782 type:complete len:108 (+) Transcript_16977:263-586(+)